MENTLNIISGQRSTLFRQSYEIIVAINDNMLILRSYNRFG